MSEKRETTVKTEYRNGKKIVTTTTVVTTDEEYDGPANNVNMLDANEPEIQPDTAEPAGNFENEALQRHNFYRAKHAVPGFRWSQQCYDLAKQHADYLARTNKFEHSGRKGFGENLFMSSNSAGPQVSANRAVDSWYAEIKDMHFGQPSPSNFQKVGHFTQVVWRDTTHVGMAYAIRGNSVIVVANYLPPGNVMGRFHEQVNPPRH